jgi:hypothetical protein
MVKAVQAEDAISDHFDRLLKDRVTAEVCLGVRSRVVGVGAGASGILTTTNQSIVLAYGVAA